MLIPIHGQIPENRSIPIHRQEPIREEDQHLFQLNKADRHRPTGIPVIIQFLQEKAYNVLQASPQDQAAREDLVLLTAGVVLLRPAADILQCHLPEVHLVHPVLQVLHDHQVADHHPEEGDKDLIDIILN